MTSPCETWVKACATLEEVNVVSPLSQGLFVTAEPLQNHGRREVSSWEM